MPFLKYYQNILTDCTFFVLAIPDIELPDEAFTGPTAKVWHKTSKVYK